MNNGEAEVDFNEYIGRFRDHDRQSQELYDEFRPIFTNSLNRVRNSITATGGLKDIAEAGRTLSMIRGDCLRSTESGFNATLKVEELKLKKARVTEENDETNSASELMRQLTAAIHTNKTENKKMGIRASVPSNKEELAERLVEERLQRDIGSKIKVNINELSMKYDYNGVTYYYDCLNEKMIVRDKNGDVIKGYPDERIPSEYRFRRLDDGIPIDNTGRVMNIYKG